MAPDVWPRAGIRRIGRTHSVDMIHCGRVLPEGVIANCVRYLTGVPFMCYVHGEDITCARASREHTILVRWVLKRAAYVVTNSRNSALLLDDDWGFPRERIRIMHPGVDIVKFQPQLKCPETRRALGWGERPVVVTVGRLQRRKGQDMLIRALPKIREQIDDVLYVIVGDGEERTRLEEMARELDLREFVQFRGETTDAELVNCYQQCDLFALPNRKIDRDIEGFGMVLLEAQACGKPVLAGDSGGTAETMILGKTGVIADCTSPDPLANEVVALLADENRRVEMGLAAREWVTERFDWSALAVEAAELFGLSASADVDQTKFPATETVR
ncbi:MAG: glycosyltransferase family 4 protein [Planctomycetes bacterium]|nr:glycosyltransferase family 4 protein [Planctomycetota bacterium]